MLQFRWILRVQKSPVQGSLRDHTLPRLLVIAVAIACVASACGGLGGGAELQQVLDVLDEAISAIESAPSEWDSTLTSAIDELESSSISVAREVSNELTELQITAAALTHNIVDCQSDKVGIRVRDRLERLRSAIAGDQTPPPPTAWVCIIHPDVVKLEQQDDELLVKGDPRVRLYGINFHSSNWPSVEWHSENGQSIRSLNLSVARTTAYELQLNLQGIDFRDAPGRSKLVISWPGVSNRNEVPVLVISPPPLPKCETDQKEITLGSQTLVPEEWYGRDKDFGGKAEIKVNAAIWIDTDTNRLMGQVGMRAEEAGIGNSLVKGSMDFEFNYIPPSGWKLDDILLGSKVDFLYYTDDNWEVDEFYGTGLVKRYVVVGDTWGSDEGDTRVTVFFNKVTVQIKQTEDCRP